MRIAGHDVPLRRWTRRRFVEEKLHTPEEKWSPLVYYDAPRCILCFRCVRVCDEGMDVKALGVGSRGVQSVILPNEPGELACEECGMCIDICPVGALTSGTYRYQTRPWEMAYVGNPSARTARTAARRRSACATTKSCAPIIATIPASTANFSAARAASALISRRHAERVRQPLVRRNGKLEPASWEDALEEIARRLKQVHATHGAEAIGVIGSNHTTNEENYLLNRLARVTLGTNNIDHHRTADYAGLAAVSDRRRKGLRRDDGGCVQRECGSADRQRRDAAESAGRLADSHRRSPPRPKLYVINGVPSKIHRKAADCRRGAEGRRSAGRPLARDREGRIRREDHRVAGSAESGARSENDVVVLFGADIQGAAIRDLVSLGARFGGKTRFMALGDYANSRGAADMGVLPDRLPGYAPLADSAERARFGKLWGGEISAKPGLTARGMMEAAVAGKLKALYVVGANPVKTFGSRSPTASAGSNCSSCTICSSRKPRSAPTSCCPPPPPTKKTAR